MVSNKELKDLLHDKNLDKTDQLLLCLAAEPTGPKTVAEIREAAVSTGLRAAKKWNISLLLMRSGGRAIRGADGWELTATGREGVDKISPLRSAPVMHVSTSLRAALAKISNPDIASFVQESVTCLEAKLYRAAVVLSWVGAVAVLYEHVLKHELGNFNAEAKKRDPKWKDAKTSDDLARMKEHELLQVLEAISVVGKSVKQELEACLKLRNGCGHPSSLKVGENRTSAHIETLIDNVFLRFS